MEERARLLADGKRVPVLERTVTEETHEITGWEPARHYSHTYTIVPEGMTVDRDGTLYVTRRVSLKKPLHAGVWHVEDTEQEHIIGRGNDEKIHIKTEKSE